MGKQKALEYAEARLADARLYYEELEDDFGTDLKGFNVRDASGGNFDDAYRKGRSHGKLILELALLTEIIALLKEEDE
jgi:hypothetical protein